MKNALKLISLMLALVMCLGVFAACGGEKKENNKPTQGGTETAGGDEPAWYDGLNFGGDTIHFLVCDGDEATGTLPSRSIWVDPEGDLSFEVNAAVNDRNKEVEAALNVEIKMTACEQGQTGEIITSSLSLIPIEDLFCKQRSAGAYHITLGFYIIRVVCGVPDYEAVLGYFIEIRGP